MTLLDVALFVKKRLDVTLAEMRSRDRTRRVVRARELFAATARENGVGSYPAIGKYIGKAHSSVIGMEQRFWERAGR